MPSPSEVTDVFTTDSVYGTPCWVSLTSRNLGTTEEFYGAVLGWRWRPGLLGERFRIAQKDGTPVAGVAAVADMWPMAVAWTPYFAVRSADEAVSRVQERGGTLAVGPISLPLGRAALLADRDGATFGVWEGQLSTGWLSWRRRQPSFVRLHTRDLLDAAIFYGEVFDWGSTGEGRTEVVYEGDEVVLRGNGQVLACIRSGAQKAVPGPSTIRPHWQVHFTVTDVDLCADATERRGGSLVALGDDEAVLRDDEGALFAVTSRRDR